MTGSHNTFTYLRPLRWWMHLFTPFARCQRRCTGPGGYQADLYDVRVRWHKGVPYVCHGPVRYIAFNDAMRLVRNAQTSLPSRGADVRLLLDGGFGESDVRMLERQLNYWTRVSDRPIRFHCGRHSRTWEKVLESLPDIETVQVVGSMQSWYGKTLPWLWSLLNRKKVRQMRQAALEDPDRYYLFDFM